MSKNDVLGVSVHEAGGVITDLLEKLGGKNGEEWLTAAKGFLRKENPWPESRVIDRAVKLSIPCNMFPRNMFSGAEEGGFSIREEDQLRSRFTDRLFWKPEKIRLHLDGVQEKNGIVGCDLLEKLEGQRVLPANVLDHLLGDWSLIPWTPRECLTVSPCFWGTIYRDRFGRKFVRRLVWCDNTFGSAECGWSGSSMYLTGRFGAGDPTVIIG